MLAYRAARQGDRAKLPQGREARPARRARRPTTGRAGAPAATCSGLGEGIRSPRAREARARRRPSPETRFFRRSGPCPGWAASGGVVTGIDTTKGEVPCHHAIRVRYPLCALLAALLLCPVATAQTTPFFREPARRHGRPGLYPGLGQRLDRLRLPQHQRQCAGDPVN